MPPSSFTHRARTSPAMGNRQAILSKFSPALGKMKCLGLSRFFLLLRCLHNIKSVLSQIYEVWPSSLRNFILRMDIFSKPGQTYKFAHYNFCLV
jgi:hypothetical protein